MIVSGRARALVASAALFTLAGCGHKAPEKAPETAGAPRLTDEQRAKVRAVVVTSAAFHPTVEVTGTVAFNGDRSTQVVSAISGNVARILTDVGTRVAQGQALAMVTSPDFAANVSAYRRAQAAWINAERIAARDSALFANDAIARQGLEQAQTDAAAAAADRDAALEALRALGTDSASLRNIELGRPVATQQGAIRASSRRVARRRSPSQTCPRSGSLAMSSRAS